MIFNNLSICFKLEIPPFTIKGILNFLLISAIFKSKPVPVPSESIEVNTILSTLDSISFAQLINSLFVSSLPKSFLQISFVQI